MKQLCITVLALMTLAPAVARSQVGHEPRHSPFRDIERGKSFTAVVGYFGGNGGSVGVGPHSGITYGLRFDVKVSNTFNFGFSLTSAQLERLIIDPSDSVAKRVSGPVDQSVIMVDAAAIFNLTGPKSWNRLAPYLGADVGVAVAEKTAADSSGFDFGTKIMLAPVFGTRVMLGQRIHFRFEGRFNFWKISYPSSFNQEPILDPGTPDAPNAVLPDKRNEWSVSPWFTAGLAFSF